MGSGGRVNREDDDYVEDASRAAVARDVTPDVTSASPCIRTCLKPSTEAVLSFFEMLFGTLLKSVWALPTVMTPRAS
jgi:hypothetical protein